MATIAAAALARLQSGSLDATALASALQTVLDERGLQIWLDVPEAQAVIASAHWDGSLRHDPRQDLLAVVDTNMGYNKANAAVERALTRSFSASVERNPSAPPAVPILCAAKKMARRRAPYGSPVRA